MWYHLQKQPATFAGGTEKDQCHKKLVKIHLSNLLQTNPEFQENSWQIPPSLVFHLILVRLMVPLVLSSFRKSPIGSFPQWFSPVPVSVTAWKVKYVFTGTCCKNVSVTISGDRSFLTSNISVTFECFYNEYKRRNHLLVIIHHKMTFYHFKLVKDLSWHLLIKMPHNVIIFTTMEHQYEWTTVC